MASPSSVDVSASATCHVHVTTALFADVWLNYLWSVVQFVLLRHCDKLYEFNINQVITSMSDYIQRWNPWGQYLGFRKFWCELTFTVTLGQQVAQLSQRDRTAGWVFMAEDGRVELGDNIYGQYRSTLWGIKTHQNVFRHNFQKTRRILNKFGRLLLK